MSLGTEYFGLKGAQEQNPTPEIKHGYNDYQLEASSFFKKLSSWREESNRQFSHIINSHSCLIIEGINDLVEKNSVLQAELSIIKQEKNGLITTVDNLNEEIRLLKTKIQPVQHSQDIQDIKEVVGSTEKVEEDGLRKHDTDEGYENLTALEDNDHEMMKDKEIYHDQKKEASLLLKTRNRNYVNKHKSEVHKIRNKNFICESCAFTCTSLAGLSHHKNSRHSDGKERNYGCDFCRYTSSIKRDLVKHAWIIHKKLVSSQEISKS